MDKLDLLLELDTKQTLSIKELLKDRTPHRADVLVDKIQRGDPITLASGLTVVLDKQKNANLVKALKTKREDVYRSALMRGNTYVPVFVDRHGNTYAINQFAKTAEFGGGGGQAGGRELELLSEYGAALTLGMTSALRREIEMTDLTPEAIKAGAQFVEPVIPTQMVQDIAQKVREDKKWAVSFVQVANSLRNTLKLTNHRFYAKGSEWQDGIQKLFDYANKTATPPKPFATQDRWNPADIWIVSPQVQLPQEGMDFEELNAWVLENLKRGQAYGTSLKKAGASAQVTFYNTDPTGDRLKVIVRDLLVSSGNRLEALFSAAQTKMTYEVLSLPLSFYVALSEAKADSEVEYRSRGGSILGTVRGKYAAQGSVGFGTINAVLRSMTGNNITDYAAIKRYLKDPKQKKEVIQEIIMMGETILGSRASANVKKQLTTTATKKSDDALIAKYQAMQLLYHVHNFRKKNKKKADQFLTNLFEYASSQTPLSSAFVKVS